MKQLAELFVLTLGADLPLFLLAIPLLAAADILGGALLGELNGKFEWKKLVQGINKFLGIYAMIFLILISGGLVDTQLFVVAGESVSIVQVLEIGTLAAVVLYATKALTKVFELLKVKINIEQREEEIKYDEESEIN